MYQLTDFADLVRRISDGAFIPTTDVRNSDCKEYLDWLEAGNQPQSAESLEEAQAEVWEQIKAYREFVSDTYGYLVQGKWFHSDPKSKTQQLGLVIAGANVPPVQWKTMDGSFITMSQVWAGAIFQAAMLKESAVFDAAERHKAAMLASADPKNYDYRTGWPAGYGVV